MWLVQATIRVQRERERERERWITRII